MPEKKYNQKPIRRATVDPNERQGWVVDLSTGAIDPDCYWYFRTREQAQQFINLLNAGHSSRDASRIACGNTN